MKREKKILDELCTKIKHLTKIEKVKKDIGFELGEVVGLRTGAIIMGIENNQILKTILIAEREGRREAFLAKKYK